MVSFLQLLSSSCVFVSYNSSSFLAIFCTVYMTSRPKTFSDVIKESILEKLFSLFYLPAVAVWSSVLFSTHVIGRVKNNTKTRTHTHTLALPSRTNWTTTTAEQTEQTDPILRWKQSLWWNTEKNKDLPAQTKWGFPGSVPTPNVEVSVLRQGLTHYVGRQQDVKWLIEMFCVG